MWQSSVMIGQVTTKIRRQRTKKKEDLNYSGRTEWSEASVHSGRPQQTKKYMQAKLLMPVLSGNPAML